MANIRSFSGVEERDSIRSTPGLISYEARYTPAAMSGGDAPRAPTCRQERLERTTRQRDACFPLVGCPRRIFIMRESGDGHWNTSSGTALPTYRTIECSAKLCGEDRQLT